MRPLATYLVSDASSCHAPKRGRKRLKRGRKRTLRANPRALVVAAPLVALLGIWAIRSAVSRPKAAVAEATWT